MKKISSFFLIFNALVFAADISVKDVYIKQTPPNATNTAIFMKIYNTSHKDLALYKVETNLSNTAELHNNLREKNKMMMIQVPKILIKANSSIELKPGGYHIMVLNLKNKIDANTSANITLYFDNNQSIELKNVTSKGILE